MQENISTNKEDTMNMNHHVTTHLKRLKMPAIASNLELREREAREGNLGYIEFLSLILGDEIASREANILAKRLASGSISSRHTFETFDFRFNNEAFPSQTLRDLATCCFIERNQNLILCGPPGIGKTHIAHALGHEVCRRGSEAMFFKTHKLLEQLLDPSYPRRVDRLWKRCLTAKLLILDDFGFRRYDTKESELLYELSDERLGKAATVVTSNRPSEDWYGIFPDPVIGGAILDRLVSGAVKMVIERARSFRKERKIDEKSVE
jgi:DNA replication protein DnaC